MFFAIVDRTKWRGSMRNQFFRKDGARYYQFSLNKEMLALEPWCEGTVYVLERDGFTPTLDESGGLTEEWQSASAAQPVGSVRVTPDDFPFLANVQGHDEELANRLDDLFRDTMLAVLSVRNEPLT